MSVPGLGSEVRIPGLKFAHVLVPLSADEESMNGMTDHLWRSRRSQTRWQSEF